MKKFALLLLTLMFTIFSFASPSMAIEKQNPQVDVGWHQDLQVNQVDSLVTIESYDIITNAETYLIKVENVAIHTKVYLIEKSPNKVYKEPIAIETQIYTKRRLTLDIQYIT